MNPRPSKPSFHPARVLRRLAALCATLALSSTHATDVVAFTDAEHPVGADGARVVLLDAPMGLEARLGAELPADPVQAGAIVRQRLAHGTDLQRRLASAYQGVAEAWGLGISKVPAVVVDRRYVVYGEPDVSRAVERVRVYRNARP